MPSNRRIRVHEVDWSARLGCEVASVSVGDDRYELPLAEDDAAYGAAASVHVWFVNESLTSVEVDDAIGDRYDDISEALGEYMRAMAEAA